jgi:hypothetical protein
MRYSMLLIVTLTAAAFLTGTGPASAACSGCQGAVEQACKKMGKGCFLVHDPGGGISGCTAVICFNCRLQNCVSARPATGGVSSSTIVRLLGSPAKTRERNR